MTIVLRPYVVFGWLGATLLGVVVARADAPTADTPMTAEEEQAVEAALGQQRDALIARIVADVGVADATRAFVRLQGRRTEVIAGVRRAAAEEARKAEQARDAARLAVAAAQQAEQEKAALAKAAQDVEERAAAARQAYLASLDHQASRHCHLVADPTVRHFDGGQAADWGRITRRVQIQLPPKDALSDGETDTMYEVAGQRERHVVRGHQIGAYLGHPTQPAVGQWLFLCGGPGNHDRTLPPPWNGERLTTFFIEPIAAPPKLAHKRALDPIHIRLNDLFRAIRQVAWKYPPDRRVLASFEVGRAMGDGRFEIAAGDPDVLFVLEVPPQLPRRTLIAPGQFVWVIMGGARFDRALRRLVLVAQDVEARYF